MKGNTVLLLIILLALGGSLYMSYTNFQQIQLLRQENTTLWVKLDSVQQIVKMKAVKPQPAPKKSTGSAFLDFLIELNEESEKEPAAAKAKQKVIVSSKYRLEDRYVSNNVCDPNFIGTEAGVVVLDISVNHMGEVKSAKLKNATGITNEDVIEACKKAALQTSFNYDSNRRGANQTGTITYTFSTDR